MRSETRAAETGINTTRAARFDQPFLESTFLDLAAGELAKTHVDIPKKRYADPEGKKASDEAWAKLKPGYDKLLSQLGV